MGQRSQIYVRVEKKNKRELYARYFQWCYGERMVSRARYTIEWLAVNAQYGYCIDEKLPRIIDTNFDMKDVCISCDIVAGYKDMGEGYLFNDYVFHYDNNDGKLLIDVRREGISYAFIDCGNEYIGDADSYMKWDNGGGKWDVVTEYFDKETLDYTLRNIDAIGKIATLMTPDQVLEFLNYNYETDDHTAIGIDSGFTNVPETP